MFVAFAFLNLMKPLLSGMVTVKSVSWYGASIVMVITHPVPSVGWAAVSTV